MPRKEAAKVRLRNLLKPRGTTIGEFPIEYALFIASRRSRSANIAAALGGRLRCKLRQLENLMRLSNVIQREAESRLFCIMSIISIYII